ncbi:MAG: ABC transporter substrate-binding protein, partial [Planctomycetes bacterium]|nr:ABC transporter substrate-binding protein [Planctomycetota bacterium]
LLIPNTVCLIKGAPHPEAGRKLIDFLLSREVESMLAHSKSVQMPLRSGVDKPKHVPDYSDIKAMTVDWEKVADQMKPTAQFMQKLFVR